jgi:predicted dehydrogenase
VEVVAIASKNKEHAVAFVKKFDIPDFYDDYRPILNRKDIIVEDLSGK